MPTPQDAELNARLGALTEAIYGDIDRASTLVSPEVANGIKLLRLQFDLFLQHHDSDDPLKKQLRHLLIAEQVVKRAIEQYHLNDPSHAQHYALALDAVRKLPSTVVFDGCLDYAAELAYQITEV